MDNQKIITLKKIPPSFWVLAASNIISIGLAISQQWSLGEVAWIYFLQSVIIGIFNFIKILSLKKFSTDGYTSNGYPVEANSKKARNETALFFLAHFGFFHLFFALLLSEDGLALSQLQMDPFFGITFMLFVINHFFSFISNYKQDIHRNLNIGILLFFPYIRVIPMIIGCIMIISKVVDERFILYFMILKSIADVATHAVEHSMKKTS